MRYRRPSNRVASRTGIVLIVLALEFLPLRRAAAQSRADFKTMYYQEDHDRVRVVSPSVLYLWEVSPSLTIRIDGVYDSITGATPTGAPPEATAVAPAAASLAPAAISGGASANDSVFAPVLAPDDDEGIFEDEEEGEADDRSRAGRFLAKAGATPAPTPTPAPAPAPSDSGSSSSSGSGSSSSSGSGSSSAAAAASTPAPTSTNATDGVQSPTSSTQDKRYASNIQIIKKLDRHAVALQLSFSTEDDYTSVGFALKDGIEFNDRCTTLTFGAGTAHDTVDLFYVSGSDTKDTLDLLAGLNQVLTPQTIVTANYVLGLTRGYLADPYKVVELNGDIAPESRPDHKTRHVLYLALIQGVPAARASVETDCRLSSDSFGIQAQTTSLAWHQKIGKAWRVSPILRYHNQSEADFYAVRFTGTPEDYSSDYRLSALTTLSYGMQMTCQVTPRLSLDAGYDRYEMEGKDSETAEDIYPSANVFTAGARLWF